MKFFMIGVMSLGCMTLQAQTLPILNPESCTSIMVGKKASADGSVITSHTCDSWYRTWMTVEPAMTYERDTTMSVYEGRMHTEFVKDQTGVKFKGTIPQVHKTYQFLDTAYPCFNEKQLAIGETTISGRKDLVNPKGMFMIEELERLALQRCTTARGAIHLMGQLIKQYGYGDWGECLTIADTKEVWQFEVFGEGKDKVGGVWAAVRIPDDEVGISANIPRISKLDLSNKNYCMASDNVFDVAKNLGYWDGKEPFCFWKAYGGGKKAFNIREYFVLSTLAPSLNLNYDAEELPFSVKPEKKLSVWDVIGLLRQTYEGTKWDMMRNLKVENKDPKTQKVDTIISPAANPWMLPNEVAMLNAQNKNAVERVRNIAAPQCAYSTVIQLRDWLPDAIGGVAWISLDNPGESPRIPVFCGTMDLPECYKICGNHRYREDTALWRFRKANKLATVKWGNAKESLQKSLKYFDEKGQRELPFVESQYQFILKNKGEKDAKAFLTGYTADFAAAAMLKWEELANKYWFDNKFGF